MSPCNHTGWLRLRKKSSEVILEVSNRPLQLLQDIEDPDEPAGIVLLVGDVNKDLALTNLTSRTGHARPRRGHGEVHLFLSSLRDHAGRPIVIADGNVPAHNRLPITCKPQRCHEILEEPFSEIKPRGKVSEVADDVYHRILSPHLDVVCLFVSDMGGIECVVQRLVAWLGKGPSSTSPVHSHFILIVEKGQRKDMQAAIDELMCNETTTITKEYLEHIRIVTFPSNHPAASHQKNRVGQQKALQKELLHCLKAAREFRLRSGYLFSARHMTKFLCASAAGAAVSPWEPFDFIHTSRENEDVVPKLATHLQNFLKQISTRRILENFAIPIISSSFVLDQYSPNVHSFDPRDVFHTLFRDTCVQIDKQLTYVDEWTGQEILPSNFIDLLEAQMIQQVDEYRIEGSSITLHRQRLTHSQTEWSDLQSDDTCFSCLRRRPQYALQGCVHSICQFCVKAFHRQSEDDPWDFYVDVCLLCGTQTPGQVIRMKPVTATTRVLSIDGGGARGRAPLENLRILEDAIGLPYPVQKNFDFVIGTSSGAMTACALFLNGWSVEKCIQYIDISMCLAFQRHLFLRLVLFFIGGFPLLPNVLEFLVSLVVDSKYSAERLEMILRDVYGPSRSIMDSPEANKMGVMLAITLTTTRDAKTRIVTNYNGVGDRGSNGNYQVLKPELGLRKIPLWEFLRCATAAPYYYTPYDIKGAGEYQDGGLTYNNPVSIGLQEVVAVDTNPAERIIAVSLGTGSARECEGTNTGNQSSLKNSYPARLYRAFCRQMSGHRETERQDSSPSLFRLDIEFDGKQPALDDVNQTDEIVRIAHETTLGSSAIRDLAREMRAEYFLFELDHCRPPQFVNGVYDCVGYISCRLRAGDPSFTAFMQQLTDNHAFLQCGRRVLSAGFQSPSCENFYLEVKFHVPTRQGSFEIMLQDGPGNPCNISGSPFTLERLMRQQKLEPWFGTSPHWKRRQDNTGTSLKPKHRKLC